MTETVTASRERSPELRRGQLLELRIDDVAAGGAGVARIDGYVVFVTGGLPGDLVEARLDKRRSAFGQATAVRLLEPGPSRVTPPCRHAGVCGGCTWLSLDLDAQRAAKRRQVVDQLTRIGGFADVEVLPVLASPRAYHYRNKMEYSFWAGAEGPVLGLHVRGRYDLVFPLEECFLASPQSVTAVRTIIDLARREGVPAYHQRRHTGVLRVLATRESHATGEILVNLVAARDLPAFRQWIAPLRAAVPSLAGFVLTTNDTPAGIATEGTQTILWGADRFVERLAGLEFEVSARAFFQVNTEQASELARLVVERAALRGEERVLDLYCGTGVLALVVARGAREVIGVETSPDAVEDARRNAARNRIANCRFLEGAVEDMPLDRLGAFDVAVVDPPRAGLHARALERLRALAPARIVYVSCNPATLARDAASLAADGYRLGPVQPLDMFPHTAHVESVALLTRAPVGEPA